MRSVRATLVASALCAAMASASGEALAATGGWTRVSPPGALGQPLCVQLVAPNGTLLALGMGIARSLDGGKSWTDASQGLDRDKFYRRPETILATAATKTALLAFSPPGVVYRSTDDGASWVVTARLEGVHDPVAVTPEPGRIHLVFGANHFDSVDDGLTWKKNPVPVYATALLARGGKLWAAGRYSNLQVSSDDGAHWQKLKRGLPKDSGTDFTALAEDGGHLYLGTSSGEVFLSRDRGESWRAIALAPGPRGAPPFNDLLFVGTTLYARSFAGLYRSERRGPWTRIAEETRCPLFTIGGDVYMTTQSEIVRSADRGATWSTVSPGFGSDHLERLVTSASGDVVAAAASVVDRTFVSGDGGRSLVPAPPAMTFGAAIGGRTILISAAERKPGDAFAGAGYLLRSEDAGATWSRLPVPAAGATWTRQVGRTAAGAPLAIDGRSVLLAAGGVLLSSDAGATWTRAIEGLPGPFNGWEGFWGPRVEGVFAGANVAVAYDGAVFARARDAGAWKAIGPAPPTEHGAPVYHVVKTLAAGGADVYVLDEIPGTPGRLYRWDGGARAAPTTAAGSDLTGRIPGASPQSPLELLAARGRQVLVATGGMAQTLFLSEDRGNSWRPLGPGLPPNRVTVLAASETGWLAGTAGAGIWQHPCK